MFKTSCPEKCRQRAPEDEAPLTIGRNRQQCEDMSPPALISLALFISVVNEKDDVFTSERQKQINSETDFFFRLGKITLFTPTLFY